MIAEILTIIAIIVFVAIAAAEFFVFQKNKKFEEDLVKREKDAKYKMYEIAILNRLSEKMGYSLSVQNIVEVIIESLPELIDYGAVSYMLLLPEKINFRVYLKDSVPSKFINDVREKMLNSLSASLKADFKNKKIDEMLWGAKINDETEESAQSYFEIPLAVSGKIIGMLAVSDARADFYKEKEIAAVAEITKRATDAFSRLQDAVESENSKMNAMVASMGDGVVMTDTDYRVLVANPAAKKALGFENKNDLSLSDFAQGLKKDFDLKDKIEEGFRIDRVFISEEISLAGRFFKIIVSPVKDKLGTLGSVVVFRDITREKEVERIKEDFTSMIVHELRSPLDSIKKIVELMRSSSKIKKAAKSQYLQMIYGSSSDMLELVNNLLDIAKIEAGKFELGKQQSDIKEIIKSRVLFFDIAAEDAKVKITTQIGKDIPEKVEFDPHTISQVLNNLISNAIKFNKKNGSIIMQALLHKNGGSLQKEAKDAQINWFIKKDILNIPDSLFVAVTNTGQGIAKDQVAKLFNKFFQAKSVFAKKGGTGLGLAITKSIIESHGGVVGAESAEGQGATFYFTLPINESKN